MKNTPLPSPSLKGRGMGEGRSENPEMENSK
jgi:hypothetical protein